MLDESEGEPLPKEKARYVFYQVMEGLEYLHFHNIMHRDIKPGNILLDVMNTAKICDFGLSSFHTEGERTTVTQGTAFFMPPEMTNESSFDPKDHDLWACGVTLYMFVFGYLPFQASNLPDLYSQIQTAPLTFPSHCKDNDLKDLLCRMLEKDQRKRLTLIEIQRHPWLKVYYEKDIQIKRERKRSQLLVPIVLTEEEVQQSFTPLSKMNNLVSTKGIASFMKKATQAKMELARSTSKSRKESDVILSDQEKRELTEATVKIQALYKGRSTRMKLKKEFSKEGRIFAAPTGGLTTILSPRRAKPQLDDTTNSKRSE